MSIEKWRINPWVVMAQITTTTKRDISQAGQVVRLVKRERSQRERNAKNRGEEVMER